MRILVTGATGLVGQGVLRECLLDPAVTHVVALGRHPSGQSDDKLEDVVVEDFSQLGPVEPDRGPRRASVLRCRHGQSLQLPATVMSRST